MANFCEQCDDEIIGTAYKFGHYDKLCHFCLVDLGNSHFQCEECGQAVGIDFIVEDAAFSSDERTCYDCFVYRTLQFLPAGCCECGKPCPEKTPAELLVQLNKKTELFEDETPTKNPFHKDCCKVCEFAARLASRTVTCDNQRVGFLMRLKLGNDPSALINRFLGGTAVTKLIHTAMDFYGGGTITILKKGVRQLRYRDDEDAPSPISYLSAQAARYEMRARYENCERKQIHQVNLLQRLFEARLELLDGLVE